MYFVMATPGRMISTETKKGQIFEDFYLPSNLAKNWMATYENSYKNRSDFFNFRTIVYLFGKGVA